MEYLHELHESLLDAQKKRMTSNLKEKIYTAIASSASFGTNNNNDIPNQSCRYKLALTSTCEGFKVGSAVNLSPATENEKRPKFQMGYVAEIVKFKQSILLNFLYSTFLKEVHLKAKLL